MIQTLTYTSLISIKAHSNSRYYHNYYFFPTALASTSLLPFFFFFFLAMFTAQEKKSLSNVSLLAFIFIICEALELLLPP